MTVTEGSIRAPRDVEARIKWFLSNDPGGVGMCARHSWRSLGGDYGNPPRWGCRNANEVYAKVVASGRYFKTAPPRGALVIWKYGENGHVALSLGGGKIATTDPTGKPGRTGTEPITYPERWGAKDYIWTDQYNGVRFPVTVPKEEDDMPSADEIADRIWKADIVPSPTGKNSPNPTWMAGSYLKEILAALQRIEEKLK